MTSREPFEPGASAHGLGILPHRDYSAWVRSAVLLSHAGYGVSGTLLYFTLDRVPITEIAMVVGCVAALFLLRVGRVQMAALLIAGAAWLELVQAVLFEGSAIGYVGLPIFPVIVMIAGLLLGRWGGYGSAVATSVIVPLAVFIGHRSLYPGEPVSVATEAYFMAVLAIACLVTAAVVDRSLATLTWHIERSQADERQAAELGGIIEEIAGEIYVVAQDPLEFLFVSRGACENLGYTSDEMSRLSVGAVFPEAPATTTEGSSEAVRTVHRRSDGSAYPVEHLLHEGRLGDRGILVVFAIDVTDRERAEAERAELDERLQQAQKLDAVGLLAGGVAHDFNNLLTIIGGSAELLEGASADEAGELAAEILRAQGQGALLTRKLLAFARQEVVQPTVLPVPETIDDARPLLDTLVGERVALELRSEGRGGIIADQGQVEQVLLNLAANARDAMPDGGRLLVETRVGSRAGYLEISVVDTGHGMEEDTLDRAFEPFYTTKPRGKGTGLGLSTVHGIVAQNDGSVEIDSGPDRGTRVSVFWPLASDAPVETTSPEASIEGDVVGARLALVVEDNEGTRRVACLHLERAGFETVAVESAEDALEYLARGRLPEVVLTDVVMPGMSGFDLADALEARWPELPVVLMSGYMGMPEALGGPGRNRRLIPKPFRGAELVSTVTEALEAAEEDPS